MGLAAGHGLAALTGYLLEQQRSLPITGWLWIPEEALIPVAALAVAGVAALIPALGAYRADAAHLLNSG
jgi:putative ABC transport system permease protein